MLQYPILCYSSSKSNAFPALPNSEHRDDIRFKNYVSRRG
jgi:hypothetical protein